MPGKLVSIAQASRDVGHNPQPYSKRCRTFLRCSRQSMSFRLARSERGDFRLAQESASESLPALACLFSGSAQRLSCLWRQAVETRTSRSLQRPLSCERPFLRSLQFWFPHRHSQDTPAFSCTTFSRPGDNSSQCLAFLARCCVGSVFCLVGLRYPGPFISNTRVLDFHVLHFFLTGTVTNDSIKCALSSMTVKTARFCIKGPPGI